MEASRYQKIRAVFHEVAELAEPERSARLEELCESPDMRKEVACLLAAAEEPTTLIDVATITGTNDVNIPGFRITRLLGEGGMGCVYEAEQHHPSRRVAIKMLRGGTGTGSLLKRFEREGQALARLKHPGIAQIYEIGSIPMLGRHAPYIAMELVEGKTLLKHAAAAKLGIRARVGLAAEVCDAIEHAHRQGVVHRDLKPGNILVDERGQPKVLDFGIAQIAREDGTAASLHTEAGQVLGTAAYMSPEQASGDPACVDVRSDVYSLGVLIYELLSGRLPFAVEHLSLPDAIRTISEGEPTRIGTLDTRYRGDIENIITKATDRDPDRRYASAAELALDLRRHLDDLPIAARRPSTVYQIRKFTRRNQGLVTSAAVVFGLLLTGVLVLGVLLGRESELRADAERSLAQANASEAFMENVLLGVTPKETAGFDTALLRRMLDRARDESVDGIDDPVVRARMLSIIGRAYHGIFEYEIAIDLLGESASLFRAEGGDYDSERLLAQSIMAHSLYKLGHAQSAAEIYAGITTEAEALGDHARASTSLRQLAELRMDQGDIESALALVTRSSERSAHDDETEVARTEMLRAAILRRLGRDDEARVLFESARERFEREGALTELSNVLNSLAILARRRGDLEDAERFYRAALDTRERIDPRVNPDAATTLSNLGRLLAQRGKPAEAIDVLEESIRQHEAIFGTQHANIAYPLVSLADALRMEGRHSDGLIVVDRAIRLMRGNFDMDHPLGVSASLTKGKLLTDSARYEDAVGVFRSALNRIGGSSHDLAPFETPLWVGLADAYLALDQADLGHDALRRALARSEPGSSQAEAIARRLDNQD